MTCTGPILAPHELGSPAECARPRDAHAARDHRCGIYPILVLNAANGGNRTYPDELIHIIEISDPYEG
jgi:hypothetical protein